MLPQFLAKLVVCFTHANPVLFTKPGFIYLNEKSDQRRVLIKPKNIEYVAEDMNIR